MAKARRATDWWRDNSAAAARHLNDLRDAAQFSVEQLAEKARVDRRTVYRLLRESVKTPQVETLANLLRALGTDIKHFKAGIGLAAEEITQPSTLDVRQSATSTDGSSTAEFHTLRHEPALLWNLPQTRNFKFTGRDDYFNALEVPSDAQPEPRIDALVGLGGVGKSHICVEYAFRHHNDFDVIWWVRGSDPSTLQADYHALAKAVALADDATPTPESVVRVRDWLGERHRWMLIIDNADTPLCVTDYIPRRGAGRVLITSLNPDWRSIGNVHEIRPFSETDATKFLERRSGIAGADVDELAHELGYLPLALEHAAAYIYVAGTGYAEYLQLYRSHRARLLREQTSHLSPIVTTWRISIDRVASDNPLAVDVLNLASCMGSASIPRDLFERARVIQSATPEANAGMAFSESAARHKDDADLEIANAIAALRRYSLVNAHATEVTVHGLLQNVVRENIAPDKRLYFEDLALAVVTDLFQRDRHHYHDSQLADRLLSHSVAVTMPPWLASTPTAVHLLTLVSIYLYQRGNFLLALTAAELAQKRLDRMEDRPALLEVRLLNQLAMLYREVARYSDAVKVVDRGVAILPRLAMQTVDDTEAAIAFLNTAAVTAADSGNRLLAVELLAQAGQLIDCPEIRPEVVSTTLANLGANLRYVGRGEQGLKFLEEAVRRCLDAFGNHHPLLAEHFNSLGAAYIDADRLSDAKKVLEAAWLLHSRVHGVGHPATVYQGVALAEVLLTMSDYQAALDVCNEDLSPAKPGTYHPVGLARWHNVRSTALASLGRLDEALSESEQALALVHDNSEYDSFTKTLLDNNEAIKQLKLKRGKDVTAEDGVDVS